MASQRRELKIRGGELLPLEAIETDPLLVRCPPFSANQPTHRASPAREKDDKFLPAPSLWGGKERRERRRYRCFSGSEERRRRLSSPAGVRLRKGSGISFLPAHAEVDARQSWRNKGGFPSPSLSPSPRLRATAPQENRSYLSTNNGESGERRGELLLAAAQVVKQRRGSLAYTKEGIRRLGGKFSPRFFSHADLAHEIAKLYRVRRNFPQSTLSVEDIRAKGRMYSKGKGVSSKSMFALNIHPKGTCGCLRKLY